MRESSRRLTMTWATILQIFDALARRRQGLF